MIVHGCVAMGFCELVAHGLVASLEAAVPCVVEAPSVEPSDWANVHIQGLGNESATITVWNGRLLLAKFNNSLRYRQIRRDCAYNCCGRILNKPLHDPEAIDWIIAQVIRVILKDHSCLYNFATDAARRQLLWETWRLDQRNFAFGRPHYLHEGLF